MGTSLCSLQTDQSSPGSLFWVCWAKETNIIKGNELLVIDYKNWVKTALLSMVPETQSGKRGLSLLCRDFCHLFGEINGVSGGLQGKRDPVSKPQKKNKNSI